MNMNFEKPEYKITEYVILLFASFDPVALDQACIDLVYNSTDPGKDHLIERIESRNGHHTIDAAKDLGIGTTDYELINID